MGAEHGRALFVVWFGACPQTCHPPCEASNTDRTEPRAALDRAGSVPSHERGSHTAVSATLSAAFPVIPPR